MISTSKYRFRFFSRVILLLLLANAAQVSRAQSVVNAANVYVSADLEVHIDGSVDNSGFIQNLGIIYFTGDWRNASVYQGAGTLVVSGNDQQTIANNKQGVYKLVIDGTGDKSVQGLLPINNQLELVSGIVFVSDNDTLLLTSSANVAGGSTQSYINGPLYSQGVGYKYFPIGKNGLYHPIELVDVTGVNPYFSLEVFENPVVQVPEGITPYNDVYWKRADVSGSFTSSPVVISYDIADNRTDTHQIDILQADDLSEIFFPIGKSSVEFGSPLDKVISEEGELSQKFFLIGESIPVGGVDGVFYISNSLSPHAANEANRVIKIFGNQLAPDDFQFVVYNRWGLKVHESESLQDMIVKGWDGRNGGDFLPAGAYPYVLKGKMKDGKKLEKKGVISIVN